MDRGILEGSPDEYFEPRRKFTPQFKAAPRPDPYTYLRTGQGWLYLATVIDLYSRPVIGWALADHICAPRSSVTR